MSAPLSGSSGGSPAPGFYPDPSIPGYIRYWNGSSWVPGTSRPEPQEGEGMPTPPSAAWASAAVSPPTAEEPAPTEETGPVFLDEEADRGEGGPAAHVPGARGESALPEVRPRGEVAPAGAHEAGTIDWDDPSRLHGQRPESASAWQADVSRQTGFAGQSDERVSWGRADGGEQSAGGGTAGGTGGGAASDPRGGWGRQTGEGRTDGGTSAPAGGAGGAGAGAAHASGQAAHEESSTDQASAPPREGTVQMRAMTPEALRRAARQAGAASGTGETGGAAPGSAPGAGQRPGSSQPEHTVGLRRSDVLRAAPGNQAPPSSSVPPSSAPPSSAPPGSAGVPGQGGLVQPPSAVPSPAQNPVQAPPPGPAHGLPQQAAPPHQQQAPAPQHQAPAPHQQAPAPAPAPAQAPAQPSWAQQVHDLAGGAHGGAPGAGAPPGGPDAYGPGAGADGVMPWRPPTVDPFLQAAQQEARPAGLGKRFGARVVDGVLTAAVAAAAAFPFAAQAADHVQAKIDAVRDAGETKTVWLIDGTTGGYLAVVLGVLLLFGLLYEVVPTQRWGRTLGKKLFGLKVLTMEQQERPGFGGALVRWLTYGVLAALVVGVVNVLWCVFDRPWRQCWHDKVAGTFVSKDSGEVRL